MTQAFDFLQDKTALITGGAGFVGSHLIGALLSHGATVICLDNLSTGNRRNIESYLQDQRFIFVEGDANDKEAVENIFASHQIDYVFHYAATVGVIRTVENPLSVLRDMEGIRTILACAAKHGCKKVIFASSSEVYGEPLELPEKEHARLNAQLPYATVKLTGEHFLRAYYETHGLPTTALRFFNVYGPKQDASPYGFVVGVFLRQALRGEPITIFGDGSQTRDFVFVEDNIQATLSVLGSTETHGEVLNIGAGRPTSVRELAETIRELTGSQSEIIYHPLRKHGEILHRYASTEKLNQLIGYVPHTTLRDGLQKTIDWYKHLFL